MVVTPIVGGYRSILTTTGIGPIDLREIEGIGPQQGAMLDYLEEYVVDGAFDIPRMLNDDYFKAINLLFNNLDSRKVLRGTVSRLMPFVGALPPGVSTDAGNYKYFSLPKLIEEIATAIGVWCSSYNDDRDKILNSIARYDTVLSDARVSYIHGEVGTKQPQQESPVPPR